MIINRTYLKLINATLSFLEKQVYYEDFLDNFALSFKGQLPVKEIGLFYLNNNHNKFIYYPESNTVDPVKIDSNLIKHLKSTKKSLFLKDDDMGISNILKKDNTSLFNSFNIDIIIPLVLKDLVSGFVIIEVNRNTYKQIKFLDEYFKFISSTIIPNIILERDNESKRKNFLKQFRHDRLAITGELAATASHEIKNIHGTVLATLAYFNETDNVSISDLRKSIKNINISLEQAEHIVKSMLSVSQFKNINIEALDISTFIEEITHLLSFRVSENITVKRELEKDLIINSSYQLLSQAIINIFTNSIDAIGSNIGEILIKTQLISKDNSNQKILQISIKDTGPGFDKIISDNLYAKFKTTKKHGTGLGLYNTLNIIKKLGGELEIISTDTGSEVIIKLQKNTKH